MTEFADFKTAPGEDSIRVPVARRTVRPHVTAHLDLRITIDGPRWEVYAADDREELSGPIQMFTDALEAHQHYQAHGHDRRPAIDKARHALASIAEPLQPDDRPGVIDGKARAAEVTAQVATAEALTRIADALDGATNQRGRIRTETEVLG